MSKPTPAEAWNAFVKAAQYVRGNPLFDAEERDQKLELARTVRGLIETAERGEPLASEVDALLRLLWNPRAPVVFFFHTQWLKVWADSDEASLRRVIATVASAEEDAFSRFARFDRAVEDVVASGSVEDVPRFLLGSLLNFALEPNELPIVRRETFEHLESRLGRSADRSGSVPEQYEHHVTFAREIGRLLSEAGVDVRDMLDIQALIVRDYDHQELGQEEVVWAPEPQDPGARIDSPRRSRGGDEEPSPYLSISACLGPVREYLVEWIEFHRLVGVEQFFLYNNQDRDAQRELLAPYVEEGTVVLYDWPEMPPQNSAAKHCIEHHRNDSRWIAFIDTDEFLFSRTGRLVPDILVDYEGWPGVGVNWVMFGPSGHRSKPPGLVIESYTRWLPQPARKMIKSIIDPTRALYSPDPHVFVFDRGRVVDENHYPIHFASTSYMSISRLQLNHYFTRSEEEFRAKQLTLNASRGLSRRVTQPPIDFEQLLVGEELYGLTDTAILRYVSALREAMLKRPTSACR